MFLKIIQAKKYRDLAGEKLILKDFLEKHFVKFIINEESLIRIKEIQFLEDKYALLTSLKDRYFSKKELTEILLKNNFNDREIKFVLQKAEYFYKEEEVLLVKNLLAKNIITYF